MIILTLFNQLIVAGPSTLFNLILRYALQDQSSQNLLMFRILVGGLVSMAISLFYLPLQLTAITLMYFDLRVRTEGFDLVMLSGAVPGADVTALTSQSAPVINTPLITGRELGNFILMSVIGVIGWCLFSAMLQALLMGYYYY
jgi:hypothetical protein